LHLRLAVAPVAVPLPVATQAATAADVAAGTDADPEDGQVGVRRKRAIGE
jgi:hypothetical protein